MQSRAVKNVAYWRNERNQPNLPLLKKPICRFGITAIYFEIKESKNLYENNTMGLTLQRVTPNLLFQGKDQRDNLRPQLCTHNQEHKDSM